MHIEFCVHVAAASCDRSTSLGSHDRTHFSDTSRVGVLSQFRAMTSEADDLYRPHSGAWFQPTCRSVSRSSSATPSPHRSQLHRAHRRVENHSATSVFSPWDSPSAPASAPGPALGTWRHDRPERPDRTGPASLKGPWLWTTTRCLSPSWGWPLVRCSWGCCLVDGRPSTSRYPPPHRAGPTTAPVSLFHPEGAGHSLVPAPRKHP